MSMLTANHNCANYRIWDVLRYFTKDGARYAEVYGRICAIDANRVGVFNIPVASMQVEV